MIAKSVMMHFTTLLTGLVPLLSVTAAIPTGGENPTSTSVSKSLISHSSSVSASASPTPSSNPYEAYTCPKDKFKSCCMSVQQTSSDIIKDLGELVPVLGGLQLSSAISFQCKNMTDQEAPDSCNDQGYAPMCCNTENDGTGFNACKPFEEVKRAYYANQMKDKPETQADMIMDILT
ncbi:hypothetical protein Pdw03_7429 [Penicillium digitatum]|uniref:Hydrophobin n=3 Tax=Penicillium digitatum TaxID=36651 RepID=K9FNZ3_PEND2|nr:hypothetical protein PDIP_49090 [Penicillium digitatum Pd1]EKV10899.1 hypothetical protein PDIG_53870 [Penicillium digitatum PHI26]EKV13221.1 hypothetical protein PDIP_49090 [Penicillium digitatum Pd1]QQK43528.1 hypothetical protein Pdw03_7429 [Penicillium digitatum]